MYIELVYEILELFLHIDNPCVYRLENVVFKIYAISVRVVCTPTDLIWLQKFVNMKLSPHVLVFFKHHNFSSE